MSEPIVTRPNIQNIIVNIKGVSQVTALQELINYLKEFEDDKIVIHSITYSGMDTLFDESPSFSSLVEVLDDI